MSNRIILGLLLVFTGCYRPSLMPVATPVELPENLAAISIRGDAREVDLRVGGRSVFQPVSPAPDSSPKAQAQALVAFAQAHLLFWPLAEDLSLEAHLFGLGAGDTGDQSRLLVALAKERGISGRLVSLPGHQLAELRYENHWHLVDSRFQLYPSLREPEPVDLVTLRDHPDRLAEALSPAGYGPSFPRETYSSGELHYAPERARITPPRWSPGPGQVWTIRPRPSEAQDALTAWAGEDRIHLLPLYHLEVKHVFDGRDLDLSPGLPILGVSFEGTLRVRTGNLAHVADNPGALSSFLMGKTRPFSFSMARGSELTLTYGLAGWVGDRLFKAQGEQLALYGTSGELNLHFHTRAGKPEIVLGPLQTMEDDEGRVRISAAISWTRIHQDHPMTYHLYLEELASHWSSEVLQRVDYRIWSWDPERMNASGREMLTWSWQPGSIHSPFRDAALRTFLLHARGPWLDSGNNPGPAHVKLLHKRSF